MVSAKKQLKKPWRLFAPLWNKFATYWRAGWWHKTVTGAIVLSALVVGGMYGIALWYQHSQKGKPTVLGVSFISDYARYLGEDPHETYQAILNDLHA